MISSPLHLIRIGRKDMTMWLRCSYRIFFFFLSEVLIAIILVTNLYKIFKKVLPKCLEAVLHDTISFSKGLFFFLKVDKSMMRCS